MSWDIYLAAAVIAAALVAFGIRAYLRARKVRAPAHIQPFPAMGAGECPPSSIAGPSPATPAPARTHIPPRIVSASGPPAPRPRPLDPEARPELPGAQPRVAKVASEEEEEAGDLEDMAREAISSTKMMVDILLDAGKDVSAAIRQLAMAEEYLEKGQAEDALKYASKAMDVAETLEAEEDRCPRCHAQTKPRWRLCPKCGHPLK